VVYAAAAWQLRYWTPDSSVEPAKGLRTTVLQTSWFWPDAASLQTARLQGRGTHGLQGVTPHDLVMETNSAASISAHGWNNDIDTHSDGA
jgi:hypothetical protein